MTEDSCRSTKSWAHQGRFVEDNLTVRLSG